MGAASCATIPTLRPKRRIEVTISTKKRRPALEQLKELLAEGNPYTLQQLADVVGVTRERVRQLCVQHGLERVRPRQRRRCSAYAKVLRNDNRTGFCRSCLYPKVWLVCSTCGRSFQRSEAERRARDKRRITNLVFCTKRCMGAWLGKTYGSKKALSTS